MQIVIDIPEEDFERCKKRFQMRIKIMGDAIANGIPLPKGHGRLIDADSLIKAIEEKAKRLSNVDTINGLCGAVALIFDAQTIIEADKAEGGDKE